MLQMICITLGLENLMSDGNQGVLAYVVKSGVIRVGDPIILI